MTKQGLAGSVLCTGGHKTCNFFQLDEIPAYPDIVTIYMGVNDWDHARKSETEYYYGMGELGSDDSTTIYGAMKMWCDRIEELKSQPEYANTKFIFITPTITSWNLSMGNEKNDWNQRKTNIYGFTLRHICNAIMEVCAQYEIPILDLNLYSGLYYNSPEDNNAVSLYLDGIHPLPEGHRMIAEAIAEFLLDNYTLEERIMTDRGHTYNSIPEVKATCTTEGISEGKYCTACDELWVVPQKTPLDSDNHIYENGICAECGEAEPEFEVSITSKASFGDINGEDALRFYFTPTYINGEVTDFGAYIIPFNIFEESGYQEAVIVSGGKAIESGKTFAADLIDIPVSAYDSTIVGVPFVVEDGEYCFGTGISTAVNMVK